jgi:hypothetical protein
VLLAALLGTLLLAVPAQSQAFFGFFGGGFSFGFGGGWGGWGGPGWWGPGYWGGPGYYWHRPYYWYRPYRYWRRPYFWGYRRPYFWGYPGYGLTLPYVYSPQVVLPAVQAPATRQEK